MTLVFSAGVPAATLQQPLSTGNPVPTAARASDHSTADALSVVKRLYKGFDDGDMAAVFDCIADDAVWTYYGPDYSLPFGGVFHGPSGVAAFFQAVDDTLTDVRAGQREFIVSGDYVSVPGWEESTVKATGGHYRVDNLHLFKVRNGKIVEFEEFINSSDVLEAFMPADVQRGKALFTGCAGCHGGAAQGVAEIQAPNLTGLGASYIVRQLRNFRGNVRGGTGDTHGFMMNGRASALPGDRGVRDVAAYIGTLPVSRSSAMLGGDAKRGAALYSSCAACHGERGEGNAALDAPALAQQSDWYLFNQMRNFRSGLRGKAAGDPLGARMRAAAEPLRDDKAVRDLIAHIKTLSP